MRKNFVNTLQVVLVSSICLGTVGLNAFASDTSSTSKADAGKVEVESGKYTSKVAKADLSKFDTPTMDKLTKYMSKAQKTIIDRWVPPLDHKEAYKLDVIFTVGKDGKIDNITVQEGPEDLKLRTPAINAVKAVSPLPSPPKYNSDLPLPALITFSYNPNK
jgi:hypothetical protein